jgi:hypothetical protein
MAHQTTNARISASYLGSVFDRTDSCTEHIPVCSEERCLVGTAIPGTTQLFHGVWHCEAALSKGPCLIECKLGEIGKRGLSEGPELGENSPVASLATPWRTIATAAVVNNQTPWHCRLCDRMGVCAKNLPGYFKIVCLIVIAIPGITELFHSVWHCEAALSKGPCLIEYSIGKIRKRGLS